MKPFIICISLATVFQTCGIVSTRDIQAEISGTYVAQWENEYSIAADTIELGWVKETTRFDIIRKTSSVQTIDSKILPARYKKVRWTGVYDKASHTIKVNNNGRILTIDSKQKILKMGSVVYRKIIKSAG